MLQYTSAVVYWLNSTSWNILDTFLINLGLMWMLDKHGADPLEASELFPLVGGVDFVDEAFNFFAATIGQAGSKWPTLTSKAYILLTGNKSVHVCLNLNKDWRVFSST